MAGHLTAGVGVLRRAAKWQEQATPPFWSRRLRWMLSEGEPRARCRRCAGACVR